MANQTTIKKVILFAGTGLHTGKKCSLKVIPAPAGTGIVFARGKNKLKTSFKNASGGSFALTLIKGNFKVITAEHLLAALYVLGIDNVICVMNSEEVPFLDGSSIGFIKKIKKTGIKILKKKKKEYVLKKTTAVFDGDRMIVASPGKKLYADYFVKYGHPLIGAQRKAVIINEKNFIRELAKARTFGWDKQVKEQRKKGLIKGASLKNAVLYGKTKIINKEGLRYKDEVVRHKLLDFTGALALLPGRIKANFFLYKSGHALDIKLMKKLGGLYGKR
jgi:UDP-3-O-[3-hydroxymyristoyl] N-acetylglucosamine deacetylase